MVQSQKSASRQRLVIASAYLPSPVGVRTILQGLTPTAILNNRPIMFGFLRIDELEIPALERVAAARPAVIRFGMLDRPEIPHSLKTPITNTAPTGSPSASTRALHLARRFAIQRIDQS